MAESPPGDDRERRRFAMLVGIDPVCQAPEVGRCRIDGRVAEFDLEGRPAAIASLHDGIRFESIVVTVVKDGRVEGLGIDTEVTNNQGLEQQPQRLDVP